ncbi:hypothetical protein HYALB_00009137 [Hymenoscyphus albidus]|uniref:Uncharacterized protein n=1 Tax=Hymenoscyphus albidus TaxID=595503 RepID=A0A9N9Q3E4_9HELO|nr:hypothetical protein HYALB_00009137 [Hymenoscyphus albidus]
MRRPRPQANGPPLLETIQNNNKFLQIAVAVQECEDASTRMYRTLTSDTRFKIGRFSVAVTCIALVGAIAKTSDLQSGFIRDVQAAAGGRKRARRHLPGALITQNITDIETTLCKHEGNGFKRAVRSTVGKDYILRLRSNLEAHKSALEIALDFVSMVMIKDIRAETHDIRNRTSVLPAIKDDITQILAEVGRLQENLLREDICRQHTSGFTLQRYLENLTVYAETVYDMSSNGCQSLMECEGSQSPQLVLSKPYTPARQSHRKNTSDLKVSESATALHSLEYQIKTQPFPTILPNTYHRLLQNNPRVHRFPTQ